MFSELTDPDVLAIRAQMYGVPDHTIPGLVGYVVNRLEPGGFLRAVLENDLKEAFGRADEENALCMRRIVTFLYNHVPKECWGSPKRVEEWLNP